MADTKGQSKPMQSGPKQQPGAKPGSQPQKPGAPQQQPPRPSQPPKKP